MKQQRAQKRKKKCSERLSDFAAFCFAVRWGVWLLGRYAPLARLWQLFLYSQTGLKLEHLFTTGVLGALWHFVTGVLLGPPGLVVYLAGCVWVMCMNRFPTYLLINAVNALRSFFRKPAGQKVVHRCYLRTFLDGHETLYDLKRDKRAEIPGTSLYVTWEEDAALLYDGDDFIRALPEGKIVFFSGLELEYIPFTQKVPDLGREKGADAL